ncbi:MAG: hypothetical protein CM1200mP24_05090 [Gammaproteobacteria bacterium]|nr:MAG: hypothetical protein CM1200mP24_05090 [Gammaproteobacteria bacterium]
MNETISARTVVYNFMEDFASATERLTEAVTGKVPGLTR